MHKITFYPLGNADSYRIDLSGGGLISMMGEDRARLMHAMTTNHIKQMKPGDWCYT